MTVLPTETGLSVLMREGSQAEHKDAEGSSFMSCLLDGQVNETGYTEYLAMLRPIYAALESVAAGLVDDPIAGAVIDPSINRLAAIDQDLAYWSGGAVPSVQSAAVDRYVARVEASAADPVLFVAHHYTRYLGDLSGGQAIGRILARTFDLPEGQGIAFYQFDSVPKPKPYKDAYRASLDALPLTERDQQRVVEEVKVVFGLNGALFEELSTQLPRYAR
ncbi:biliverdin-producing heme oxygenase [Aeromicrobium sp. 636]|uniref:Biliverdin-producing heme oxygenase n=1 Tax=Aeromicrobium senzhongii TaxID=2663859 RepID=A0A8I0EW34_9ACTN|nr:MULTISPECIES: biliverdin-producing heme oxygenase [Aeromicrobium]MBC9226247.1 biliverdin-producing heme oxygenase [Aeromicrobium senzhongii]MCQ3998353.1 biliverdin-producing heme oxygenase [Aeromicrobium sp. 636]MTB88782.1 biliverdin-producing heme oxygenase [Aeromicrobium senzhongii]QNL93924.1 biliverdin-producing heme oxygenase [Aeromicrobium senzhongii]